LVGLLGSRFKMPRELLAAFADCALNLAQT